MDDLKKNAYWVVMGVLALAAGIFWAVEVAWGKNVEVAREKTKLESKRKELQTFAKIPEEDVADPRKGMPVPKIADYWEAKKRSLDNEKGDVETRYRNRKKAFDVLPPGVSRDAKGEFPFTDWITGFHKEVDELKTRFKPLVEEAGADKVFGFHEPQPGEDAKIALAQKQYLMAKAIAECAKEAGAKSIAELTFKDVSTPEQKPGEKGQPKEIATRIGCAVTVHMPFPGAVKLVSKILRHTGVVFDIREVRTEACTFTVPDLEPYKVFAAPGGSGSGGFGGAQPAGGGMKGFKDDVLLATQDLANPKTKNPPPELQEPPVAVHLALDALDFDLPAADTK
jgi:hypothetical protein